MRNRDPVSAAPLCVTASLGPAGPLLQQLRWLSPRPDGVGKREIRSLTKDLDKLCISLMAHSEAEEPSSRAKSWMTKIRELCYDTKNYLDDAPFILKQDDGTQLTPQEKRKNARLKFKTLKSRAKHERKRRKRYEIDPHNMNKVKFMSVEPRRLPVLHAELIDRGRMDTLANKLMGTSVENPLKKAVVSLVGLEGVGKTTLAKRLYCQIGGKFQCRAFVRVSHNPDMRMLLASIFTQIQLPGLPVNACCSDAQHLIKNIKRCLQDKRYLIILDDLWSISVWDIIRRAFPDDDYGSRILTTTQCENVASACCSYNPEYIFKMEPLEDDQSERLLFGMVFGSEYHVGCSEDFASISDVIISKSGGLPLSIVNLASLLPTPGEPTRQQWFDFRDSLPPTLRRSPSSEGIKEVLYLIYNHLSPELKTCLLYLVFYPEGYTINKHDLVKQWVAEGFTGEGQNKEETAGEYFDELVSRGMIQVVDINYRGVLSCTLHRSVHNLSVKKSMEGNFIIGVDYFQKAVWLPDKVRRLYVQFGGARSARLPAGITLSEVRSLAFFGFYGCADFIAKCKLLRVLTLHLWAGDCVSEEEERLGIPPSGRKKVLTCDLSGISKLLPLRYLKIACNIAVQLPDDIQDLQYLETLEVDATVVAVPSDIGRLSRLSSLKIAVEVLARQDISILQALQALSSLSLHVLEEQVGMIVFDKGGFSVLKYFKFRCSVPCLKFEAGAMPDLQNLDLNFNAHEADHRGIVPIGIEHLPGLKEVNAEIWGTDNDVGSTFRTAISNHPSNPRIIVQLVDSSIFYGDTTPSMGTEEKVYMSKDDGMGEEKKQTADSSTSTLPLLERMSTLLGSSLPVQGATKKPTLEIETDSIEVKAQTFAYCPEIKIDGPEEMDIQDLKPSSPMNKQTDINWQPGREDEKKHSDIMIYTSPGPSPRVPGSGTEASREAKMKAAASPAVFGTGDRIFVPWKDGNINTDPEKMAENISTRIGDANVLERILDGTEEPTELPLALLQKITDDFSEERKIGQDGFGAVYKGVHRDRIVAVKRMNINKNTLDDMSFRLRVANLMKINHQNVVRFLGFCSITHSEWKSDRLVNVNERLLCLQYISNGSLDKYISDQLRGFQWETRYEIITGICEGLRHLHEDKNIIHMDLKPGKILLDGKSMVPKITDFGLSRPNKKTYTMAQPIGTSGYVAPEYLAKGDTTMACDIYSLGAIIRELVTGDMNTTNRRNVLRRWRHRWNEPPTQLRYQQVTRCIQIARVCMKENPEERPHISEIISFLRASESTYDQDISDYQDDDMLGIEPLNLEFNKDMSWSVKLTNKTKTSFAFNIEGQVKQCIIGPYKGIVTPECNENITVQAQKSALQFPQNDDKIAVRSTTVRNGFTVDDIDERTFRKEDHKVVDEVDIMVVPKVEQRNIGETSSGKGKVGSSENVEAASMCKYYPPKSFSRTSPTDMTYLGEASHRAVDVVRGPIGSLLHKLGKLFTEDYSLADSIKSGIRSFSEDLRNMHRVLLMVGNDDKDWVEAVRQLAYKIEDMVDSFLVHREPDSSRRGFREIMHDTVELVQNGRTTHRQIGDVIEDIKADVKAVADRQQNYKIDVKDLEANTTTKVTTDPRMAVYSNEPLIGIEAQIEAVKGLFEVGSNQELRIVSIVGLGGLGKTSLAKAVYDKSGAYQCKAFVPVGQNPVLKSVLKQIIRCCQGQEYSATKLEDFVERELIDELNRFLKNKRYFIVIDDLWSWELWGTINSAFPRNKCGSRVITTTRNQEVIDRKRWPDDNKIYRMKELDNEYSRRLFVRRISGLTTRREDILKYILTKCGGMPLAINSISSHLDRNPSESSWEGVRNSFGAITGNEIECMNQILDLSYTHLPDHLKTCLLQVCMYPEDHEIDKNDLLGHWVAEGFVSTDRGQDAEEVAEKYFKALIDTFMIQPEKIDDYSNEVLSCKVHDIILELMRSKSNKEKFIHVPDGLNDVSEQIRRVSVQYNDKKDGRILETIERSLEHVRSVLLFRASLVPDFLKYKYIRVLHIEDKDHQKGLDLTCINRLSLLRYLKIACSILPNGDFKLPDQIGELQQLETIDLQGGLLKNYPPDIVSLPLLLHLRYGGRRGIALPDGIDRLESLRTLVGVCVYQSSVDNINGLSKLTNLRQLQICSNEPGQSEEANNIRMAALQSSIQNLSGSLRILNLGEESVIIMDVRGWIELKFPQVPNIRELDLGCCNFESCPKWIGQLDGLYKFRIMVRKVADGLTIVAGLPSLAYFYLYTGTTAEKEKVVVPGSGAFQALKHLIFNCPKASLAFEAGAMPNLEKLQILFRYHMARRFVPAGIEYLQAGTLKKISLCVDSNDRKVKGSKHWDEDDWHTYWNSEEYNEELRYHTSSLRGMLKRAFKQHHPNANIVIHFEEGLEDQEYGDEDDNEEDGEEEDVNEEDEDEEDDSEEDEDEDEEDDSEEDEDEDEEDDKAGDE